MPGVEETVLSLTWASLSREFRKPDQIVHPFWFGDPIRKATCLWLKGLPPLVPTNVVEPEPREVTGDHGRTMPKWYSDAWKLPPHERAMLRSKTFPGIARAMATQWGKEQA